MFLRLLVLLLILFSRTLPAQELLEVEQAFKFSASVFDEKTVEVRYDIARGYYLYKNNFRFAVEPAAARLGPAQLPPGKIKKDDFFGEVETYRGSLSFLVPVEPPAGSAAIKLSVTSQGCADIGVCYPPTTQSADLVLVASARPPTAGPTAQTRAVDRADTDWGDPLQIARVLRGADTWLILSGFFGVGLLLTFTPCVFPMLPIISGIIVGQGPHLSRVHALGLSAAYVLGMAVTYAAAGVAAGLSGALLSAALQNAWVLSAFAGVFVALALAMFGFYELQLPAALQSRLANTSSHIKGGAALGVAAMGALSAIIVGPCVAAPLAAALLYIAQTGDAVLGGSALFVMALGMGVPVLVVGVSARSLLPKAGPWMESVKKSFGVLLLAVAIWILNPVLPTLANMLAWAALLILSAIYLHALDPLPPRASGWRRFWKGVGVVSLLIGASLLVGAMAGSRDPLQPLAVLRGAVAAPAAFEPTRFERVRSIAELDARLKGTDRPVMLDFYADWCVSCKEMDRFTFSDPRIKARFSQMLLLQADVTAGSADDRALLERFKLFGPPGIVFFNSQGREISGTQVIGYQDADRFLKSLRHVQNVGATP